MTNRLVLLLGLLSLCSACTGSVKAPSAPGEPSAPIYVIGQGWHAGIAIRRSDLPPGRVPENADFPDADYLELGWGDRDFYQANDPGSRLLLDAALRSTASVLHVVGVEGSVADRFDGFEIVRLDVARSRVDALAAFIHASFLRDGAEKADALRPGYGRNSLFYPATGAFHLFNNCNTWTARALEAAGYPMGKPLPFTAGQLMARVRRHAAARDSSATPAKSAATTLAETPNP